jgi:hypothetical protein
MCRRCGEPDKRGNTKNRRARKQWLLTTEFGGSVGKCVHCERELTIFTVEADRIIPGGSYRRENIWPACGPCNRSRRDIPEDCAYG